MNIFVNIFTPKSLKKLGVAVLYREFTKLKLRNYCGFKFLSFPVVCR
jgi:hypothetical protein